MKVSSLPDAQPSDQSLCMFARYAPVGVLLADFHLDNLGSYLQQKCQEILLFPNPTGTVNVLNPTRTNVLTVERRLMMPRSSIATCGPNTLACGLCARTASARLRGKAD